MQCMALLGALTLKRVLIRIHCLFNRFILLIKFLDFYDKGLIAIKFLDELTWYQTLGQLILKGLPLSSLHVLIST